ncbi:hypothetical protein [Cellulomonas sp. SG140]|uniref:hypothetical protein n=1 Tax=Cellulomonas sp. SG140 TaxID=2976536 RepID=UPI0021E99DCE|nr:hypothetical protein [Cellulomonas sp. SG140]
MTKSWSGGKVRAARALVRRRGRFQQCQRCGCDLDLDQDPWHAGHVTDRMDGGSDLDVAAECPRCNLRAGGRRGAAITNARRSANKATDQRLVKW